MPIAVCAIRALPHYRREAFIRGLKRAGYSLIASETAGLQIKPADVLVTWNRSGAFGVRAADWERRGGTVVVCENGYYGRDEQGRQHYALAIGGHNGSGYWPEGDAERLTKLGIEFQPWRTDGRHILICLQRGIGLPKTAQPPNWEATISAQLATLTARPIRVRQHPGRHKASASLADDLRNAWAVVTWASNCATAALIAGVPVFYCAQHIITEGAAIHGVAFIENPEPGDRITAFQRLASAQWSVAEIELGTPFMRLRDIAHQQQNGMRGVRGGVERDHRSAGATLAG